ncbi:MAG: acyl-CoA synthetase, partial [Pseudomonadota bacterium]|nr:acyl-CoA synthetase [Pseudomonadota bacterium]
MTADDGPLPDDYRRIPKRVNICREVLDKTLETVSPDRPAFVWNDGSLSYGDLATRVKCVSAGFRAHGIERGTPVVVRMSNSIEFAITFLALTRIGALPVLQNSLLGEEEVEYVIEHAGARAAVTLDAIAEPLRSLASKLDLGLIIVRGAHGSRGAGDGEIEFESLLEFDDDVGIADTEADEPAFMVYTSGTTGRPKGIVHGHRWVIALGDSNRWRVPVAPDDVALATGEWSFISALGHNLLFPLRNGVTGAILEGRAGPEAVLGAIERHRVTVFYSVATVYRRILAMDGVETRFDLSSLRGCNATGEALEEATWREFKDRIGCDIWEHYGVSEMQMVL